MQGRSGLSANKTTIKKKRKKKKKTLTTGGFWPLGASSMVTNRKRKLNKHFSPDHQTEVFPNLWEMGVILECVITQ